MPWECPETTAAKLATWARIRDGAGFLYLAAVEGVDLVKIGFSLNPERRARVLRGINGERCRLLAMVPGTYRQERFLHGKLVAFRVGGFQTEIYRSSVLTHAAIPEGLRGIPPSPKPPKQRRARV